MIKGNGFVNMEIIDRSFSGDLPKGELFIDDIEKIFDTLSGSSNRMKITIDDQYEINDLSELEKIQDDEIQKISMTSNNPQVSVDLDRKNSRFYSAIYNRKNRIIYEKIYDIIEKRKYKKLFFKRYPAILGILLGIALTFLSYIAILGIRFTLMSTPGLFVFFIIFVESIHFIIDLDTLRSSINADKEIRDPFGKEIKMTLFEDRMLLYLPQYSCHRSPL